MNEAISVPKAIVMGTKVRLRNEAFKNLRAREWQIFRGGKRETCPLASGRPYSKS